MRLLKLFDSQVVMRLTLVVLIISTITFLSLKNHKNSSNKATFPTGDLPRPDWQVGYRYTYLLNYQSQGHFQLDMGVTSTQGVGQTTFLSALHDAKISLFVLEKSEKNGKRLLTTIEAPNLEFVFGTSNQDFLKKLRYDLAQATEIVFNEKEEISHFIFAETSSEVARNLNRDILKNFFPPARSGPITEPTIQGSLTSLASQAPIKQVNSPSMHIHKTFQALALKHRGSMTATIDGGADYEILTTSKQMQSVKVTRSMTIRKDKITVSHETLKSSYAFLDAQAQIMPKNLVRPSQTKAHESSLDGKEGYASAERKLLERLVQGTSFPEQMQTLFVKGATSSITDNHVAFQKLLAFLKLDPSLISSIARMLEQYRGKDGRFDLLATLLVVDGSELSQSALLESLKSSLHDADKTRQLLFNLALLQQPNATTIDELIQLASRQNSAYHNSLLNALGGVGYHSTDIKRRDQIFELLTSNITTDTSDSPTAGIYVALGNLGHAQSINHAKPLLEQKSPQQRRHALETLRRIEGDAAPIATSMLLNSAHVDPDVSVRRDAAKYLVGRAMDSHELQDIVARFYQERDVNIAQSLLEAIDRSGADKETIKDLFMQIHKTCGSPQVCGKIESLLLRNS